MGYEPRGWDCRRFRSLILGLELKHRFLYMDFLRIGIFTRIVISKGLWTCFWPAVNKFGLANNTDKNIGEIMEYACCKIIKSSVSILFGFIRSRHEEICFCLNQVRI